MRRGEEGLSRLKVPVPADIFRYALEFAYSDSTASLNGARTIESLCELLACADLLLMDQLKQVAEVKIVPLLTLKNIVAVSEIAQMFNCKQLFRSCVQFATYNLQSLVFSPSFHNAEVELLEAMETYYRGCIPDIYRRATPPSQAGP